MSVSGNRLWRWSATDKPWFDQPDSLRLLEKRRKDERLADTDFEQLYHWLIHGYCIVDDAVDQTQIDRMEQDLDALWDAEGAIPDLEFLDLRLNPCAGPSNVTHSQLLALHPEIRRQVKLLSHWRIHGFHRFSPAGAEIFRNSELAKLASLILGTPAVPSYSINFARGSEQDLHQDTAVFHVVPPNFLVGAWLACENILPESGALVIYPGSHKSEMYPGFENHPQTNLRTSPDPGAYAGFVHAISQRYESRLFLASKGQVLLWHGMLIHGGSPVFDRASSRRSYVCHYIPPGMDVVGRVEGPFNW